MTAISRRQEKAEDAKKLGADKYIAMSEGIKGYQNSLDLIICTISKLRPSISAVTTDICAMFRSQQPRSIPLLASPLLHPYGTSSWSASLPSSLACQVVA